ncbi:MAG: amino acid permease [Bacteroidota bacterium]|nr:amino acid permease [Candidatus Kapabacteria bacterium]MDW8220455.1 amino acid permease [Bacteroidota bacterium]
MANLTARKNLAELINSAEAVHEGSLKRSLGPFNLVMLGIGAIIGAGIFVLTGEVASQYAGPAITISFIIAAFACACAGLCYAELASMIPIAGSVYTYSYATVGEFFAWIVGWDLIIEYLFAASTVSVGWSGYIVSLLKNIGITIPSALTSAPFAYDDGIGFHTTGALINLPAVAIILVITIILVLGVQESARFNNVIVAIKTSVIVLFLVAGVSYVHTGNWVPFIPENTGEFGRFGWTGIFRGAAIIFFAYIGFDAVSTAAQEAKNPQRDLPIGILGSLIICTLLYIAVGLVLTGIVPYTKLAVPDPIAVGIDATGLTWLSPIIKLGAIAGLSSVILVMLLGQPRIFFTMANDGLLPAAFSKVHPKFKTPYISTIITGAVAMALAAVFPIGILSKLVSLGTLLAFAMVCLAVLILRKTHADTPRPFKTPLTPLVPIAGIAACLGCMAFVNRFAWELLGIWMALGITVYFLYGAKHSKAQHQAASS